MIPTKEALEALAKELGADPDKFEDVLAKSEVDDNGFRYVRVFLLGGIDGGVHYGHIDAIAARRYYAMLGFTAEEMSDIRQRVAIDPRNNGEIGL